MTSPTQCSFVPRRQITDNIIIVKEMLHTMRKKQGISGYMALKINFKIAYDRLWWSFIHESLLEMWLPLIMFDVIIKSITSISLQILWNGEPTNSFSQSRGIRQGDPISPYIYVICMERLTHLIEREVDVGAWKPVQASRNRPKIYIKPDLCRWPNLVRWSICWWINNNHEFCGLVLWSVGE